MIKYKANVALVAVISMIAISIAGGFALTVSSVNFKLSTIGFIASTYMEQQIHSCKEEAFRQISRNTNYVGNNQVNFSEGNCTYTVSVNGTNSNYRDVQITSTHSDFYKSTQITVDTTVSPIREL